MALGKWERCGKEENNWPCPIGNFPCRGRGAGYRLLNPQISQISSQVKFVQPGTCHAEGTAFSDSFWLHLACCTFPWHLWQGVPPVCNFMHPCNFITQILLACVARDAAEPINQIKHYFDHTIGETFIWWNVFSGSWVLFFEGCEVLRGKKCNGILWDHFLHLDLAGSKLI